MVEAFVEQDYTAKEPNELSLTKGDIIRDVIRKQGGWWEGTLNDKKGLFPDNFVRVLDKTSVVMRSRKDANRIRQCRVVFSYKQDHEDELNLNVGDIIEILGEEEEGWWRGVLNGKQGVFPSNFVEEITPRRAIGGSRECLNSEESEVPGLPEKPVKILCEVKFAYKAQNNDELNLKEGDLVTLLNKDGQDPGWWKGELNGKTGVFPDNFVTVLPTNHSTIIDEKATKDDKKTNKSHCNNESVILKPSTIAAQQRKSTIIDANDTKTESDNEKNKAIPPPVVSKKPTVPIKKSPSNSGSGGGLFQGLKKKIVDVVDGATGSKHNNNVHSPPKTDNNNYELSNDNNIFDDVVRRPLLADVRATRPKAPGRRPPSVIFKESEPGMMNGNTEHINNLEILNEPIINNNNNCEIDGTDKPKLREWEKHKAPWLEEMKLNQAKRTSTSPGPPENKLKLTPTEKTSPSTDTEEIKVKTPEKETSPIDMKSFNRLKASPPNETEKPILRNKGNVPTVPPIRPQTIQNINEQKSVSSSSKLLNKTPSPLQRPINLVSSDKNNEFVTQKQFIELLEKINKLEEFIEKQNKNHLAAIEDLNNRLQIEIEMRMALQTKFEES